MTDTAPQPLDLEAVKARCEAAKPGPWKWETKYVAPDPDPGDGDRDLHGPSGPVAYYSQSAMWCEDADAEFIAAARSDVPALVAEVERLRTEVDRLNHWIGSAL